MPMLKTKIRAQDLRWVVDLQSFTAGTPNEFNEATGDYEIYARVWAKVTQTKSSEIKNERIVTENQYDVVIWYLPDVTSSHRIVWEGKTLEIYGVSHDQLAWSTTLSCREVANG